MKSTTNLELKHFCDDFNTVRTVLKSLGVRKNTVKRQTDYFFDLPENRRRNGRLKLRVEGTRRTLIYYERPDFKKGAATSSMVKLYPVNDRRLKLFLELCLGIRAVVRKTREVWKKGDSVFHLDRVDGVGRIFEIELQKKKVTRKDVKLFKEYQRALSPYLGKVIKGSNVDLVK